MVMRALVLIGCFQVVGLLTVPAVGAATSGEALRIARESQPRWTLGAVAVREKHGRMRVRADLVADGVVIAHLRLDPATGDLVAGKAYARAGTTPDLPALKAAAARALARVEIGNWAWPAEHGRAWRVPLRYDGHVIATVTVDARRNRLIGKDERDDAEGDD